jgi:hypothetical protein
MKALVVSGLVGAVLGIGTAQPTIVADLTGNLDGVFGLYDRIFPKDPLKREALAFCFQQDHGFNRLDDTARRACYEQLLPAQPAMPSAEAKPPIALQAANFVDLWQDAGRGHAPKNDVRLQQETNHMLHPALNKIAP